MAPPVAIAPAAAKAIFDLTGGTIKAINDMRLADWAQQDLLGDLRAVGGKIRLIQTTCPQHVLPSTLSGIEALQQLRVTVEEASDKIMLLRSCATPEGEHQQSQDPAVFVGCMIVN